MSLTACQISISVNLSISVHLQWAQLGLHEAATACWQASLTQLKCQHEVG